jgi:hypothetical protein
MNDKTPYRRSGIKRHACTGKETCCLLAISTKNLEWTDYQVRILDISAIGLGIESDKPLETALICLKEPVWGYKCGYLVWCKQFSGVYRAGIQFVSLSQEDEDYLWQQIKQLEIHKPFPDPRNIISKFAASI